MFWTIDSKWLFCFEFKNTMSKANKSKIEIFGDHTQIISQSPNSNNKKEGDQLKSNRSIIKTISITVGIIVGIISIYEFTRSADTPAGAGIASHVADSLQVSAVTVKPKTDTIIKYKEVPAKQTLPEKSPVIKNQIQIKNENGVTGIAQDGGTVIQNNYINPGRAPRQIGREEVDFFNSIPKDYKITIHYISNHAETNEYAQQVIQLLKASDFDVEAEGMLMIIGNFDQRYKMQINKNDEKKKVSITILEQIPNNG